MTTNTIPIGVLLRAVETLAAVRKHESSSIATRLPGPLYMQLLKSHSEMSSYAEQILAANKVEVV